MKYNFKKKSIIENFKYYLISLISILGYYKGFFIINLGYFLLIIFIIIYSLRYKLKFNEKIVYVMASLIVINLFNIFLVNYNPVLSLNNSISMIIFTFLVSILCSKSFIDQEKLYNVSKKVALVCVFFGLIQFYYYNFLGEVVYGNIPFLTPMRDGGFASIQVGRITSFFSEPAHFGIFLSPILSISLLKKDFIISLIILIGMLLSASSTSILLAGFIILFYILNKKQRKIINIFIISCSLVLAFSLKDFFLEKVTDKLTIEYFLTNVRLLGTLQYFENFDVFQLFFGIGLNNLVEFMKSLGVYNVYNYANAYFYTFFSFGLIGGIIWIGYNVYLSLRLKKNYKILFIILFLVSLSDQLLFNYNLIYLLIWCHSYQVDNFKI